jgi:arabinose-5-phosphate isomerase
MLTDKAGKLTGLFTDSDLARLVERRDEKALDRPIRDVMAARPTTVVSGTRVREAVALLAKRKFSELPVVDKAGRPVGLVDVTDVLGLPADEEAEKPGTKSPKKAA